MSRNRLPGGSGIGNSAAERHRPQPLRQKLIEIWNAPRNSKTASDRRAERSLIFLLAGSQVPNSAFRSCKFFSKCGNSVTFFDTFCSVGCADLTQSARY
jgi:hypothetical protein